MSIRLNEPKVACKTSAKKVVVGPTRRRKVVFSTDESQEKRSSGTRSGTLAILVIRLIRGNGLRQRQPIRPTNMSSAGIGWYLLPESPYWFNQRLAAHLSALVQFKLRKPQNAK